MRFAGSLAAALMLLLAGACSERPVPPPKTALPRIPPPPAVTRSEAAGPGSEGEYRYDPEGKPDPFRSFVRVSLGEETEHLSSPLERFDLSQLVITGIVWGPRGTRALVRDPAGKGYIVSVGAPIGKNQGRVVAIEDNRVVVEETYVDFHDRATTKAIELHLYGKEGG